jgi:hypothetical protein
MIVPWLASALQISVSARDVGQRVHARAAILFRHFDAHEAQLTHFAHGVDGKFGRLVMMFSDWGHFILGKAAGFLLNHLVFFGNKIKHCGNPPD